MSSMRLMQRLLESEPDNTTGSHCLVEWMEEGNPRNVVDRRKIVWMSGIGQECEVRLAEKSQDVLYRAKLIACGKLHRIIVKVSFLLLCMQAKRSP